MKLALPFAIAATGLLPAIIMGGGKNAAPLSLQAVTERVRNGGDLGTGLYVRGNIDLSLPGPFPITLQRVYRTNDQRSRALGIGDNDNFDMFLVGDATTFSYVDLILPDGGRIHYVRQGPWTDISQVVLEHSATPTPYWNSRLTWNGRGWDIRFRDGSQMQMSGCNSSSRPGQCGILAIKSATETLLTMTRNSDGDLMRVAASDGRGIDFEYDTGHRIRRAVANNGHAVEYYYDEAGHLLEVHAANGAVSKYAYDASSNLIRIQEPGWRIRNHYDAKGRFSLQTGNWTGSFRFRYTDGAHGLSQAEVIEPDDSVGTVRFNSDGYAISEVHQVGSEWKSSAIEERAPTSNAVTRVKITCEPNGDAVVLSGSEWNQITTKIWGWAGDVVCLALLHDSRRRQRLEMALNHNDNLPR